MPFCKKLKFTGFWGFRRALKFWTAQMPRPVTAPLGMSNSLRVTKSVGRVDLPSGAALGKPCGWLENVRHRRHECQACLVSSRAADTQGQLGSLLSDEEAWPHPLRDVRAAVLSRGGASGKLGGSGSRAGVTCPDSQLCPQEG